MYICIIIFFLLLSDLIIILGGFGVFGVVLGGIVIKLMVISCGINDLLWILVFFYLLIELLNI